VVYSNVVRRKPHDWAVIIEIVKSVYDEMKIHGVAIK